MEQDHLSTLRALGFEDEELRVLGLWGIATGDPDQLAEAYFRRSKKGDDLVNLRQQVRDVCRMAAREGNTIRRVWFEQLSASKAHVRRGEFERATTAILDGTSRTLYVWKTDRLSRRGMGQVGLLLDELDARRARLVSVTEGLDSSRGGRMTFIFLSERAREEVRDISLRTKAGGDAHKAEGRWPGGVVPYGLECPKGSGKLRHNPDEYKYARPLIAERLLEGVTPANIANDLNDRKIPTRKGKRWRAQTIIHLAQSPSWAGLIPSRERKTDELGNPMDKWHRGGEPLMGENGLPIRAGQGVVTVAEWENIRVIISSRSRPGTTIGDRTRGVRKAVTIMTGILRCPHCKGPMGNGGRNYRCLARINQGKSVCRGVATTRGRVDDAMEEIWATRIMDLPPGSPALRSIVRRWISYRDPVKEMRKCTVGAALEDAVSREFNLSREFFMSDRMDEVSYETLRGELTTLIANLKAELADLSKEPDPSHFMDGKALMDEWKRAGVEGRRALLRAALNSVIVEPPKGRGDKTPISQRLVPCWWDEPDGGGVVHGAGRTLEP